MGYILLTVVSAVFLSLYDFFKKIVAGKKTDIYEVLFFYTFIAFVCGFFFFNQAITTDIKYIFFVFIKALVISLSWLFTMKAVTKLDLSIVTPFSLLGTIFTIILSWIFFNQEIGIIQICGSLIILCGLILLARINEKEKKKDNDYKYLLLIVLSAFLSSISAMIDKAVLSNGISKYSVLFWFFLFLSLIYLIVCLIKNKKIYFENIKSNLWTIAIGVCIFLADLFYYQAVSIPSASISTISIVRKLSVFFAVILGSMFLKEGNLLKKSLILIFMIFGLFFIIYL